jgi:molybdopterin molybdotransferase
MTGTPAAGPLRAHAGFEMRRKAGRAEFIPVRLVQRDACVWAERVGSDGSGRLAALLSANGFAFLFAGMGDIFTGEMLSHRAFHPLWRQARMGDQPCLR